MKKEEPNQYDDILGAPIDYKFWLGFLVLLIIMVRYTFTGHLDPFVLIIPAALMGLSESIINFLRK